MQTLWNWSRKTVLPGLFIIATLIGSYGIILLETSEGSPATYLYSALGAGIVGLIWYAWESISDQPWDIVFFRAVSYLFCILSVISAVWFINSNVWYPMVLFGLSSTLAAFAIVLGHPKHDH